MKRQAKKQNQPKDPMSLKMMGFLDLSNLSPPHDLPALTAAFQEKVLDLLPNPKPIPNVSGRNQQDTVTTIYYQMYNRSSAPVLEKDGRPTKAGVPRFENIKEATTLQKNQKPPVPAIVNAVQFRVDITQIESKDELDNVALELAKMWVGSSGPCAFQPLLARRYPTVICCPNPWCVNSLCAGFHIKCLSERNAQSVAVAFMEELKKDLAKSNSSADTPQLIHENNQHDVSWRLYASHLLGMDTGNDLQETSTETLIRLLQARIAGVEDRVATVDDRVATVEDRVAHVEDRVAHVEVRVARVEQSLIYAHHKIDSALGAINMALLDVQNMIAALQAMQDEISHQLGSTAGPLADDMMVQMSQPQTYGYPVMPASAMTVSGTLSSWQSAWHSPDPFSLPVPSCPTCSSALTKGADCRHSPCRDVNCKGCHSSGCDWLSCSCGYNVIAHIQSTTQQQPVCAHTRCKTPSP